MNKKLVQDWLSCWQLFKALAYVRDAIRDERYAPEDMAERYTHKLRGDPVFDALRQLERAIIAAQILAKSVQIPERHKLQVDLEAAAFCCDQADMESLCMPDDERPLFYQGVLRDIRTEAGSFIRHCARANVWLDQYEVEQEDIEAIVGESLEVINTMDWFELLDILPGAATLGRDPAKQKLLDEYVSCEDSWQEFADRCGGAHNKDSIRAMLTRYAKATGQSYAKVNK